MSGTSGTVRTVPYLLSQEFEDGQAVGSITPQDIRDMVVSFQAMATLVTANVQTTNYTLALTDATNMVEINAGGGVNVTVPPNSSVAFTVGSVVSICQVGAGQVTVVAGTGVTIDTPSTLTTRARWSTISLRKRATDEWVLSGDMS